MRKLILANVFLGALLVGQGAFAQANTSTNSAMGSAAATASTAATATRLKISARPPSTRRPRLSFPLWPPDYRPAHPRQ